MDIFIEVMTVFWKAFWGFLSVIGSTIWENLPMLLEIKKIMGFDVRYIVALQCVCGIGCI